MKQKIIFFFITIFLLSFFNFQIMAQPLITFLKWNGTNVVDASNREDPNIIYWSNNVKQTGLPVLEFNTNSVPLELFSYTSQVASQASNCVSQWETEGCLHIDYNILIGCVLRFSSDPKIFTSTTQYGATQYAVTYTGEKYQFEVYPSQSLSYPFTAILLNGTDDFLYEWTTTEDNIGIDYTPFKAILLHEMGHLVGLGHIYDSDPVLMDDLTLHNNFLFNLTTTDQTAISELCSFNGTPVGIEDAIFLYTDHEVYDVNTTHYGCQHTQFIDQPPENTIIEWYNYNVWASSSCGDILVSSDGIIIPTLPTGYYWIRDANGNVIANMKRSGIDDDGILHTGSAPIKIGNVPNTFITSGTLTSNTYWCGAISITGTITVPTGITLEVYPGANISFANNASLIVQGKLYAMGCTFASQSGQSPNSWGSITLSGSGASGSSIKYAYVKYGSKVEATNTSNIIIQNCNIDTTYDGIYFYNSTGSILNNTITTNSIGHGIRIEGGSTATCNDNVITKTNANRNGVGILFGGGSGGYVGRNDIYHWDWGVGAIWSSSPQSWSSYYLGKNNRIRNCNAGIKVYRLSYPVFGYSPPCDQMYNSFSGNTKNVSIGTSYPEYNSGSYACGDWWGSATPDVYKFEVGQNAYFYYTPYLSSDPWAGMAKVAAGNAEDPSVEGKISEPPTKDFELFLYGIELRLQNKYSEAKDLFVSYIANHPDYQAAYVELYNCYNKETADDIIKFFNSLPEKASKDHNLLLSYLYLKNGDFKNAKEVNNTLITENPNTQLATRAKLNNVYIALYNEGNINEAITIFNEVLSKIELSTPMELSLVHNAIETYAKTYSIEIKGLSKLPDFESSEEGSNNQEMLVKTEIPDKYALFANYPNPFNPSTTINYALPVESDVTITIFDLTGSIVKFFVFNTQSAGYKNVLWDGSNNYGESVSSGVYIYTIKAVSLEWDGKSFTKSSKLMLLK